MPGPGRPFYRCPAWLYILTVGALGALLTLTVSRAIDFAFWVNR